MKRLMLLLFLWHTVKPSDAASCNPPTEEELIARANEYRKKHDVPAYNNEASKEERDDLRAAVNFWKDYSDFPRTILNVSDFGESYIVYNPDKPSTYAVDYWYETGKTFNYEDLFNVSTGEEFWDFTQLIWKNSQTMYCEQACSKDNTEILVVCRYKPPGNGISLPNKIRRTIYSFNIQPPVELEEPEGPLISDEPNFKLYDILLTILLIILIILVICVLVLTTYLLFRSTK